MPKSTSEADPRCSIAVPDAMRRLIELVYSDDERVATVAINAVLDRAWGKPREAKPEEEQARPTVDTSRLTEAQKQALLAVFRAAAMEVESRAGASGPVMRRPAPSV
jgi:hypothetical protein